ncbi:MAG TPA: hypothetical protein VFY22_10280 [Hydrogenophaga sp.]|nr:hypothetical protein [Hydrogenophaga sp.]
MTRSTDDPNTADTAPDRLLQRYREANALDEARPSAGLRDAVLAQARAQLAKGPTHPPIQPHRLTAANDRTWTLRALGTLAVLGLVGLLVLQFDQGTPDEREVAFGAQCQPSTCARSRTCTCTCTCTCTWTSIWICTSIGRHRHGTIGGRISSGSACARS